MTFPAVGGYLGAWSSLPFDLQQTVAPPLLFTLTIASALLFAVLRPVLFASSAVRAGELLHNDVFRAVLSAPLSFFDARPSGSVLSRFSRDVQVVDERLPLVACDVLLQVGRAGGVLALVCAGNPWVLLALPVLLAAFARVRATFVTASRAIKRLESASRPRILTVFGETLAGLPVIRAMGASLRRRKELFEALDGNSRPWTAFMFATRWLALRLDLLCVAFLTLAAAAAVLARGTIAPGAAAMSLSFVTMLLGELDWMVRQTVELENAMLSVERLLQYKEIEGEDVEVEEAVAVVGVAEAGGRAVVGRAAPPPLPWPSKGLVEMRDVWMSYAPPVFALRRELCCAARL